MTTKQDFLDEVTVDPGEVIGASIQITADADTDVVTFASEVPFVTGDGPFRLYVDGAGDLPAGLAPNFAQGVLTVTGSSPIIDGSTVIRVGSVYYQFAADPTTGTPDGSSGTPFLVDIGANDTGSLANLLAAINADGTPGTTYSEELVTANAAAEATDSDATTLTLYAKTVGVAGNSVATVATGNAGVAFGATTLLGGLDEDSGYYLIMTGADTAKLASTKANALAGTAINMTDDGTGDIYVTTDFLGFVDALDDLLNDLLTSPGNRVNDPATNRSKFWEQLNRIVNLQT